MLVVEPIVVIYGFLAVVVFRVSNGRAKWRGRNRQCIGSHGYGTLWRFGGAFQAVASLQRRGVSVH
jgi:hypothetical protein